jgi:hypothetical protein
MSALQQLPLEALENLNAVGARDLVVECFFAAQRETLSRAAATLKNTPDEARLKKMVEGAVRLAFRSAQGDFEKPTKASLAKAVDRLAGQAAAMGTPPDIIEHHRTQLGRIFAALPDEG